MRWALGLLLTGLCAGCAADRFSVREAFPPGSVATPWVLQNDVWVGTFDEATSALGDDAEVWRDFGPTRVWLAIYCHENEPQRCLKVRCLAFASDADARRAFDAFRPLDAKPIRYGDVGCWTEFGVLYQWGCLVFDIFGGDASWGSQVQSTMLAALIAKRMPPAAPGHPQ